jgi:hypothetical protein
MLNSMRLAAITLVGAVVVGCSHSPTSPAAPAGACTSRSGNPTYGCAVLELTVRYATGQLAPAFIFVANSDTARYHLAEDSLVATRDTNYTIVEFQARRPALPDTASFLLRAQTPPTTITGTFECTTRLVQLHVRSVGGVPDTLRAAWVLPDRQVAQVAECGT